MAPLTKETIEAGSTAAGSAAPRSATPAQVAARQRADAVSLEIPIKVHGSRVTEVVRGVTPHTEPFEEETTTMIVFAQGGVLKMSTPVTSGQMMVLTNLKSRQDVICRVLKVRNNPNLQAYVEVEFTHPQPGYWGVFFPSDEPELGARPANTVQSLNLESETKEIPSHEISRPFATAPNMPGITAANPAAITPSPVAAIPSPYAPPPKPGSAFISIGSQEEVQVAASTTLLKNGSRPESAKDNRVVDAPRKSPIGDIAWPPVVTPAPVAANSGTQLQADAQPVVAFPASSSVIPEVEGEAEISVSPEVSAANSRGAFGEFGTGPGMASPREILGSNLSISGAGTAALGAQSSKNWILIAACAVAVFAAGGAAVYFFRAPAGNSATTAVSAPQNSQTLKTADAIPSGSTSDPASAATTIAKPNTAKPSKVIITDHSEASELPTPASSSAKTPPAPSTSTPKSFAGTLAAHPVMSQHRGTNEADAPTLDAGIVAPAESGTFPGMPASSNAMPPPPLTRVRVGGELQAPKLISTIPPVYPPAAKDANVDGDVVIHAVIDKSGNVAQADVISGPAMLRQAALAAVRRWKYAPSLLDGQPVEADTKVTVKFQR